MGGAGGLIFKQAVISAGTYTVAVGGAGSNSSFNEEEAIKGGDAPGGEGESGGSGGGGSAKWCVSFCWGYLGGSRILGQGHDGGQGRRSSGNYYGGNGGGAGGPGSHSEPGAGLYYGDKFSDNVGDNGWFASGGARMPEQIKPGGGGAWSSAALPNTGGGGGFKNLGGSGIVIIRYAI